jgi:hypothetical protein
VRLRPETWAREGAERVQVEVVEVGEDEVEKEELVFGLLEMQIT